MKVILLEKVKSLGSVGEIVNVAEGFARNYLMPKKWAVAADSKNSAVVKDKQKALAKKASAEKGDAEAIKKKLEGTTLELIRKVGANGKLFGSVTTAELSRELEGKGIVVERRLLTVDGSIKGLGTFEVKAKLYNDVVANFKVKVIIDPAQAELLKKEAAEAAKRNAEKKAKAAADKAAAEAAAAAATEEEA